MKTRCWYAAPATFHRSVAPWRSCTARSDLRIPGADVVKLFASATEASSTGCRIAISTACSPPQAVIFNFHGYPC